MAIKPFHLGKDLFFSTAMGRELPRVNCETFGVEAKPQGSGGGSNKEKSQPCWARNYSAARSLMGGGETHPSSSEWEGRVGDDAGKCRVKSNWRNQYWERTEGGHRTQEEIN